MESTRFCVTIFVSLSYQQMMSPKFSGSLIVLMPALIVVLGVALYTSTVIGSYVNNWRGSFHYSCPRGKVIQGVSSVYSNHDRRWSFSCASAPNSASPTSCILNNYPNTWRRPMNFRCPNNYVITGVLGYPSSTSRDRRLKFKCCKHSGYRTTQCRWTYYRNNFQSFLTYSVPSNKVLAGWASVFSSTVGDRRHKFLECSYAQPAQEFLRVLHGVRRRWGLTRH